MYFFFEQSLKTLLNIRPTQIKISQHFSSEMSVEQ